jgi:hypothetical protein
VIYLPLAYLMDCILAQMSKTYVSRCHFDANLYSEPMAIMNLLWEFNRIKGDKHKWCMRYGIFLPRVRRLNNTCENLRKRVAQFLNIPADGIVAQEPPLRMPHAKVTLLRIIKAWVFHDSVIQCRSQKFTKGLTENAFSIDLQKKSARIEKEHLHQVLSRDRHPFELKGHSKVEQKGTFDLGDGNGFSIPEFEERLLSYSTEKSCSVVSNKSEDYQAVYIEDEVAHRQDFAFLLEMLTERLRHKRTVLLAPNNNRRGRAERPCGLFLCGDTSKGGKKWMIFSSTKISLLSNKQWKSLDLQLQDYMKSSSLTGLSCAFTLSRTNKFQLILFGSPVSQRDLADMFAASSLIVNPPKMTAFTQQISFPLTDSEPLETGTGENSHTAETSWDRPPISGNIPEGARVLSLLASDRRKEHVIRLGSGVLQSDDDDDDSEALIDIHLETSQTKLGNRWTRFGSTRNVFVDSNSVPATAIPLRGHGTLLCMCANTLEVRGGGARVEGLTLLPQGRLFFMLCRITFGLYQKENVADGSLATNCINWIMEESDGPAKPEEWDQRIGRAVSFHEHSIDMGEKLECFPEKVIELLAVFDGFDEAHKIEEWGSLFSDPFIGSNMARSTESRLSKKGRKVVAPLGDEAEEFETAKLDPKLDGESQVGSDDDDEVLQRILAATSHLNVEPGKPKKKNGKKKNGKKKKESSKPTQLLRKDESPSNGLVDSSFKRISVFSKELYDLSRGLFATDTQSGSEIKETDVPSSNILAIVVQEVRLQRAVAVSEMTVDGHDWTIYEVLSGGVKYFQACFNNTGLRYTKQISKRKRPWITEKPIQARPTSLSDAADCVPPAFQRHLDDKMSVLSVGGNSVVVFQSIEMAIRMEAAFWLERQFCKTSLHWYEQEITSMVERLLQDY